MPAWHNIAISFDGVPILRKAFEAHSLVPVVEIISNTDKKRVRLWSDLRSLLPINPKGFNVIGNEGSREETKFVYYLCTATGADVYPLVFALTTDVVYTGYIL